MWTPEIITAILGVGGLGYILPKLIDGFRAWRSGKAAEEKTKNQSLLARLVDAEARAEREATFRRTLEEYAGALRRMLVELGMPAEKLPAWPVRKD